MNATDAVRIAADLLGELEKDPDYTLDAADIEAIRVLIIAARSEETC